MSERDENRNARRDTEWNNTSARHLSLVGLEALANYKAAGLAHPGERMHEQLAKRLARVAATDDWNAGEEPPRNNLGNRHVYRNNIRF